MSKLSQIISADLPLVKRGSDRYWTSPAHDSLIVDDQKGKWHWYSRDKWGDSQDWLIFWRGIPKEEARRLVGYGNFFARLKQSNHKLDKSMPDRLHTELLKCNSGLRYLESRGLNGETINKFRLGYKAGKIAIPNFDENLDLVGMRYRLMRSWETEDGRILRYFSEKGSHAWIPYGLWLLPRNGNILWLVEGEFKCMVMHRMGFQTCIGTQGISFRGDWIPRLNEWDRIVYLRDTRDLGGVVSANRIKKTIKRLEIYRMPWPHKSVDDFYVHDWKSCQEFVNNISS